MRIEDVMTRSVATCRPEDQAAQAARIMWDLDVGCVPVLDDEGDLIGVVTDRDLCMASYTRGKPLTDFRVDSVMTKNVKTCRPNDSITHAEDVMAKAQIRRLPVLDDLTRLVGIVSLGDLARARSRAGVERIAEHVFVDVAKTLAAITEPRPKPSETRAS